MSLLAARYDLTNRKTTRIDRNRNKRKPSTLVLHLEHCGVGIRIIDLTSSGVFNPRTVLEVDDVKKMWDEDYFSGVISKIKFYQRQNGYDKVSLADYKNYLWKQELN